MKQNRYDDEVFFEQYSQMGRSQGGLEAAGEWQELKQLLPDFRGLRVLDLGCGYGWHCIYAAQQGAAEVVGIDLSEKMLEVAREKSKDLPIRYVRCAIEDYDYPAESFDVVLSSLALHYVEDYDEVCRKVARCLVPGGVFLFSAEHPVFTAREPQQWVEDDEGRKLHWPVDNYFIEGKRQMVFLGEPIQKYHRTLSHYASALVGAGFELNALVEPRPNPEQLATIPEMADELRRPMMLILRARKR